MDAEAQFRSLAEPWADTGTSTGRLMIAVLGGLADVEVRELAQDLRRGAACPLDDPLSDSRPPRTGLRIITDNAVEAAGAAAGGRVSGCG